MLRDNIRIHGNYTPEELEDLMDMIHPDPSEEYSADCPSDDIDPYESGLMTDKDME